LLALFRFGGLVTASLRLDAAHYLVTKHSRAARQRRLLLLQPEFTHSKCSSTESSVDDLGTCRGVVLSRAATILRSIETQPSTGRFVRFSRTTFLFFFLYVKRLSSGGGGTSSSISCWTCVFLTQLHVVMDHQMPRADHHLLSSARGLSVGPSYLSHSPSSSVSTFHHVNHSFFYESN
jgi:hypothetical protein